MMMLEMVEWTASIIAGFIALILFLRGFCLIRMKAKVSGLHY